MIRRSLERLRILVRREAKSSMRKLARCWILGTQEARSSMRTLAHSKMVHRRSLELGKTKNWRIPANCSKKEHPSLTEVPRGTMS
jgi:hypothetical protein